MDVDREVTARLEREHYDRGVTVPLWLMATCSGPAPSPAGRVRHRPRQGPHPPQSVADLPPARGAPTAPWSRSQITRLIARGASTADMAEELFLSPYTVRDHVKSVLRKVEVSSRGELVAKLFAEYYKPTHDADVTQVDN